MDFKLSQEQEQLKSTFKKFTNEVVAPLASRLDKNSDAKGCVSWDLIENTLMLGISGAAIPKTSGGSGLSHSDIMIIAEELAQGDSGLTNTVINNIFGSQLIMMFGTDQQKNEYLPLFTNEKSKRFLVAFALTEPQTGSDNMSPDPKAGMLTYAQHDGDGYILNGKKTFITSAGLAGLYLVWARTDKTKGAPQGGLSAFLVPSGTPGLEIGKIEDKMGQRLSQHGELLLNNCKVPAENLLGKEGMGFQVFQATLGKRFTTVGAIGIGIAQAAFEIAYKYAKERVQGGMEIINHQAIAHKLSNMLMMIESTRTLIQKSAWLIDNNQLNLSLCSMCKVLGSEAAFTVANEAIQILGGYGYSKEFPVEKLLRDARALTIYEAGSEIHRGLILRVYQMMEQAQQKK